MHSTRTPINHMLPQHGQYLTILPPCRHRPIRRFESPYRLRPLPTPRRPLTPRIRRRRAVDPCALRGRCGKFGAVAFGGLARGRGRFLRGPVVDVPVVFVEEEVVLLELGRRHAAEVGVGEGGEEEIRFEGSAFSALVFCAGEKGGLVN